MANFGGSGPSSVFTVCPRCEQYPTRERGMAGQYIVRCGCGQVVGSSYTSVVREWRERCGVCPETTGAVKDLICPRCGKPSGRTRLSGMSGVSGRIVECTECGVRTYEYVGYPEAIRAWNNGYVATEEEMEERRRMEYERVMSMIGPSETKEGTCWCLGVPWPKER